MELSRFPRSFFLSFLVLPVALGVAGCGGKDEAKHAEVKAGSMPEGGEWQGVYFSPLYGYLHVETDGDSANAGWRTASGEAYGELHGKSDGNLLNYEWKERKIGAVGADALKKGKGYFVYKIPTEGEAHEIQGQWGLGDENAGNDWKAVKQKNMPPNLKSVQPDEYEGRVSGGGWDTGESGSESGEETPKEEKSQ